MNPRQLRLGVEDSFAQRRVPEGRRQVVHGPPEGFERLQFFFRLPLAFVEDAFDLGAAEGAREKDACDERIFGLLLFEGTSANDAIRGALPA